MLHSLRPYGLWPTRFLCLWNYPDRNTGVGCHTFLQRIFLTQGSNLHLPWPLNCRQILYHWATGNALLLTHNITFISGTSQVASVVNNPPANAGDMNHGFDPWVRKIPWRRKWQPTLVFVSGEFHRQRSLAGYIHGIAESDTTEWLTHTHMLYSFQVYNIMTWYLYISKNDHNKSS